MSVPDAVPPQGRRFHVYVVELDRRSLGLSTPCVYVGETGLPPAERLTRHLAGGRTAARVVSRHGLRLRPDLCPGWGPYRSRDEATHAEAALARTLRGRGYRVFGGQGYTFCLRPTPSVQAAADRASQAC